MNTYFFVTSIIIRYVGSDLNHLVFCLNKSKSIHISTLYLMKIIKSQTTCNINPIKFNPPSLDNDIKLIIIIITFIQYYLIKWRDF